MEKSHDADFDNASEPKLVPETSNVPNTNQTPKVMAPTPAKDVTAQKIPWVAIIALAMGMLVYGVAESYGPVSAISSVIPREYAYLGLSLPYIAGGIGALLAGYLADKLGRRNSFILVAAMILVGIVIYVAGVNNVVAIVVSFVLIGMAAIGLETPIITAISELISAKWRGNLEVIVQNFGNLGVAIVFIPLLLGFSSLESETAIVLLFIAPLAALIIGYWAVKETLPWQAATGKSTNTVQEAWSSVDKEAEAVSPTGSFAFRFIMITLLGIAQDVAFVYITYDVGYTYYAYNVATEIPLIGGLTMVVVGMILGALFVHRISRKSMSTLSYGMMVILWVILWAYVAITKSIAGLPLLFLMTILFIPVELTWGTRAMLEPELFPTEKRGTYVSYVRAIVWIIAGTITGVLSYYYLTPFNIEAAVVTLIFIVALIFAVAWQLKGFETGKKGLSGFDVKQDTQQK